jgi:hypothetical protein
MSRVPHLMQWLNMSLGVDAIIHVASPLAHTAAPEVILDVRNRQTSFSASWLTKSFF